MSHQAVAMTPPIKIFLADANFLFIEGLSVMLSTIADFELAGMTRNASETLHQVQQVQNDIILVDANFFFQGHCTFGQHLREVHRGKILVLHDAISVSCLKKITSLADGFLSKTASRHQLCDSILAVVEGRFIKQIKGSLFASLNSTFQQELVSRYELTPREVEVIRLIALEFLSVEIAQKLCVSEHTVDTYRKNITKKLNVRNVAGIVNFAHRWQLV
ncbi:hypothetical protein DR864_28385 (plasmid) [Runella rosea]|uniref:Uncharacterized protein n=2 Tax=Runella rosea TaxID=2259595 RepID=A0A344TT23_9BACT|nr:hypothetical protein DR864_28385 [Runella rosea]